MAAAAMRSGPPIKSRRRPPRRQTQQFYRGQYHNFISYTILFLLLALYPGYGFAEPPSAARSNAISDEKSPQDQSSKETNSILSPRKIQNLTVGFIPAVRGIVRNRQGLQVSGAITMALDEVILVFIKNF